MQHMEMSAEGQKRTDATSFDHLICSSEHGGRDGEANGFRGFQIHNQFVLSRLLHWQVGRLFALQNTVNVASSAFVLRKNVHGIAHQPTASYKYAIRINHRQSLLRRSLNY